MNRRKPGRVILVGHSYGGAVITEAGNDTKVAALVYVAAFVPDAGESVNDLGKGHPAPPWVKKLVVDRGGFASLPADVVANDFAQDPPAADTRLLAAKQGPIAARCFDDKITTAAWQADLGEGQPRDHAVPSRRGRRRDPRRRSRSLVSVARGEATARRANRSTARTAVT